MKSDVWVWEFGKDYPGADNDDTHLPIGRVWLKTHERSSWFSPAHIAHFARIYGDQGIALSAWCVPVGSDWNEDARLAIRVIDMMVEVGIARPALQLDFEWEPQTGNFWKGKPAHVAMLVGTIKDARPDCELRLCLYQYEAALGFAPAIAMPEVHSAVTMDYWTDFGTSPTARLRYSRDQLAPYGKPIQYGLPGNATSAAIRVALEWCTKNDAINPPIIWRRGTTSAPVWEAIAEFDWPVAPLPPAPVPAPSVLELACQMRRRDQDDLTTARAVWEAAQLSHAIRASHDDDLIAALGG